MDRLSQEPVLAVDFEGEWNLHRYGLHLCLIQISDSNSIYIVDPLKVGPLDPFLRVMEDPGLRIISHGPQSDIILLDYLFSCRPRNIFDTEKAAKLLGYESTSLSSLLEKKFGIKKNTKVRASNWNIRPISQKMLDYAALDVRFLHQLREVLIGELKEKDRLAWLMEECKLLEDIRYRKKEQPYLEINHAQKLSPRELTLLKHIYTVREQVARELDKPAYYIIPNNRLLELAQSPPEDRIEWEKLKGVNPKLRNYASDFHQAVQDGKHERPDMSHLTSLKSRRPKGLSKKAYYKMVDQKKEVLESIKVKIDEEYDISQQIISSRIVKRIAYGESRLDELRNWQKAIIFRTADDLRLDLSIFHQ